VKYRIVRPVPATKLRRYAAEVIKDQVHWEFKQQFAMLEEFVYWHQ
jgi:hypothetical protein